MRRAAVRLDTGWTEGEGVVDGQSGSGAPPPCTPVGSKKKTKTHQKKKREGGRETTRLTDHNSVRSGRQIHDTSSSFPAPIRRVPLLSCINMLTTRRLSDLRLLKCSTNNHKDPAPKKKNTPEKKTASSRTPGGKYYNTGWFI